nr:MAG TPA: hypothetical protein [Caudoviricetes sp.]
MMVESIGLEPLALPMYKCMGFLLQPSLPDVDKRRDYSQFPCAPRYYKILYNFPIISRFFC